MDDTYSPQRQSAIPTARARRFTLVELLIVISIIAMLTSLLLPALGKAKEYARASLCASNQRQIYQGCFMYVTDWNGYMPYTDWNGNYAYYINEYLMQGLNGGYKHDGNRILYFGKPTGLFFCPSLSSPPEQSPCWTGIGNATKYQASYQQTHHSDATSPYSGCWTIKNFPQRRLEQIKSGCAILGDKNWKWVVAGTTYQCYVLYYGYSDVSHDKNQSVFAGHAPGWNHALAANFLFTDGHVQSYKYTGFPLFDDDYIPK